MIQSHLMVIDPSTSTPEINAINNISCRSPLSITIHFPALFGSDSFMMPSDGIKGIIIMGSLASVYDQNEWQNDLKQFVFCAIDRSIPILGLCYGHQFLAHIFGGKIEQLWEGEKRRGTRQVELKFNKLWGGKKSGLLAYSHLEGVVECPEDFEIAGSSDMVPIEAISSTTHPIWGFQPHIEATADFLKKRKMDESFDFDFGYSILDFFLQFCYKNT